VIGGARLVAIEQELPAAASEVYVCIRAEDVILLKGDEARSSARNRLPATVRSVNRQGPLVRIDLDCGFPLIALLTKQACEELALAENDRVIALVKAPHIHLIPRSA
jgi:molybdate transport system ATP-binding protein